MQEISDFIMEIENQFLVRLGTAFLIVFAFWMLSSGISFLVIKTLKVKEKNPKNIKTSSFYNPLQLFIKALGIYLAILFMKDAINLKPEYMEIITKVFRIIVILIFARGLAQAFSMKSTLVKEIKRKSKRKIDDSMLKSTLRGIRAIIYVGTAILVITQLGYNLNGLIAGAGIVGVIVTLAAQDTAKNLFGGLVIFLDKPFVVGDWIQVNKFEGTVEEITFRSTRIRSFENSVINIPNAVISDASVINWSKMEKRRYLTRLYLDINTPLEKVEILIDKIKKVLLKHEQIEDDSIIVKFEEIVDNGIEIMVLSYTDSVSYESYLKEREIINYKIMQIVREEKIKLAENSQIVHVKD